MSQQQTDSTRVKVKRLIGLGFEYGGIDLIRKVNAALAKQI